MACDNKKKIIGLPIPIWLSNYLRYWNRTTTIYIPWEIIHEQTKNTDKREPHPDKRYGKKSIIQEILCKSSVDIWVVEFCFTELRHSILTMWFKCKSYYLFSPVTLLQDSIKPKLDLNVTFLLLDYFTNMPLELWRISLLIFFIPFSLLVILLDFIKINFSLVWGCKL